MHFEKEAGAVTLFRCESEELIELMRDAGFEWNQADMYLVDGVYSASDVEAVKRFINGMYGHEYEFDTLERALTADDIEAVSKMIEDVFDEDGVAGINWSKFKG